MAVPAEPCVYNALALVSGLVLAGALVAAKRNPGLVLCIALLAFVLLQTVIYNAQFLQPQGRYLFPALVPLAVLAALGFRELSGRWYPASMAAMATVLVALNLYADQVLIPRL